MPDDFATALSKAKAPKKPPAFGEALAMSRPVSVDDGRATPEQAATARTAIFGSADPDSQPAPDEMVDALLDVQGHGQRVESEIAKYSKELDRESFPGIFKAAPSDQALEFERMGGAEGYRKAERDLAIERMGGRPTMGAARRSLSVTDSEARAAEDQAKIRQSENPILRYGARLATDFKEGYENAGAWVRESLIRPVAPEAARALDSLSSRAGMSEEGKAIVREDTKGLLGDIIGMVGQTAAFIPQVAIGGVPGAAAVSAAASGGDAMAGLETAAFLKTAGGLTRLFGGASESVIRQVLAEGAAMTAAGAATRLGFHGDAGTLQQAGVDALSGLAFGVMGGGARAREAAARFRSGLEAGKTIETAAREAGIPPERLADPTPPVEAPRPVAADPVKAPERAPEIAPQSGVVTPTPVEAPAPTKPVSEAPVAPIEAPAATRAEAPAPRPVERPVEPTPPPVETPRPEGVSIKNESVNARRESRGLEPVPDTPAQTFEGWNAAADKAIAENPNKPYEVIADLKRTGRAHTPVEVAILTRHQVDLAKAYKKAADDVVLASERGDLDAVKEAKARAAEISLKDMEAAEVVGKGAGAEAARALAARKMTLAEDYSLLAMERKARVANDGKPLPEKTATEIKVLSERMEKIQGELDALKAARSATRTSGPVPTEPGYGKANKVVTPEAYAATKAALRDKLSRMSAGIDPTILADMVKMGAFHVEAGLRNFAAWSKAMLDDLGEKAAPHLKDVWRASQTELGKPLTDAKASLKATVEAGKRVTDNPVAVQKIAEHFVRTGVTERGELIEKVHEVLQASDPSITFRQTMDAISGYGAFKALDKDPAKIRLRELKAEMQQIGKLEDMAAGKAPAKTGVERQPMTDEARELSRKVNEEKRRGGYEVVDPERQLKSALDGVKTRLRNEIVDLERQIASKTKDVPNKTRIQLDEEAAALKARRDAVKAEFDAAFGTPGLTDAQRVELAVRAAERSVAALEKQIERGDVFPEPKAAPVSDPRLDALRARREELVKKREDMRASALEGSKPSKVQQSIDRAVASLDKSIADYKAKLASGDIAPRPKGSSGPTSPKIEALKAERDSLRKQIEAARSAARPRLSPDQIALKSIKSRLSKQIADLENRIATSDFKKREKAQTPRDTQAIELEAKRDTVKREYETALLRLEWSNKSALRKAGSIALGGLRNGSRAIMTAWDFSVFLKQAFPLVARAPINAIRNLGPAFKSVGSVRAGASAFGAELSASKNPIKALWRGMRAAGEAGKMEQAKVEAEIRLDPMYHEAKKAGLFLSEHGDSPVSKMDEAIVSGIIGEIPGVGGSQRAYTVFLNKMRFDAFKSGLANLSAGAKPTPIEARTWAAAVNRFTGRGGPVDSKLLNALSEGFFAPRLAYSRFEVLFGQPLLGGELRGTGEIRKRIFTQLYVRSAAGLGIFYGLARLAGGDIERDGKVRFGNAVIDPTAGFATAIRILEDTMPGLFAGITGGERKKRDFVKGDEASAVGRYLRNKASPLVGVGFNLMTGKTPTGEKATIRNQAEGLVTPMATRDIYKTMKEHGIPKGAALSLLSLFGMGLQNYEKRGR